MREERIEGASQRRRKATTTVRDAHAPPVPELTARRSVRPSPERVAAERASTVGLATLPPAATGRSPLNDPEFRGSQAGSASRAPLRGLALQPPKPLP